MSTNDPVQDKTTNDGEVIPPALAIKAMCESGYKNTAYALAELIDNAIQAEAELVEIFCVTKLATVGTRTHPKISHIAILDNGFGMNGETLRLALQFGRGTHLNDRDGIGRFGMGLPNASISQCQKVEVWSWQSGPDNALYTFLDRESIETGETRVIPAPVNQEVPAKWRSHSEEISSSGTLIVWSNLEGHKLTWKKPKTILDHTEMLIGRMYRKFISDHTVEMRLVEINEDDERENDRRARANDPLYLMESSNTPEPFGDKPMFQRWGESDEPLPIDYNGSRHIVHVRMSWAKPETLPEDGTDRGDTKYGKHAEKNIGVSIVRAARELELDRSWALGYNPTERWWGVEVEFPPELDDIFGVTNNKQAATIFSSMSRFDWKFEAEPGESYSDFKRRLEEEGDTRCLLMDIVDYIETQLSQIRSRLKDQTKGRRGGGKGKRHEDTSVEDTATTKFNKRAEQGHKIALDGEIFGKEEQQKLEEDLEKKHYEPDIAKNIAEATYKKNRKVIFVQADTDSQAFFNVETKPGGITEIVLNSNHPAYEKLFKALSTDISEDSDNDLVSRIENASDTLKLILAAWARYEQEDIPSKDKIRDIRHEWGKMAKNFLIDAD